MILARIVSLHSGSGRGILAALRFYVDAGGRGDGELGRRHSLVEGWK